MSAFLKHLGECSCWVEDITKLCPAGYAAVSEDEARLFGSGDVERRHIAMHGTASLDGPVTGTRVKSPDQQELIALPAAINYERVK